MFATTAAWKFFVILSTVFVIIVSKKCLVSGINFVKNVADNGYRTGCVSIAKRTHQSSIRG